MAFLGTVPFASIVRYSVRRLCISPLPELLFPGELINDTYNMAYYHQINHLSSCRLTA